MRINDIKFTKPKKIDGKSYICQLYFPQDPNKRKIVKAEFYSVKVIKVQKSGNDFIILLKNKNMQNFMCDLNTHIVDTVKSNCLEWFGSVMDTELIEDYFTSTIIYNKTHGDLIKIHCSNIEYVKAFLNKKCEILISFDKIKFHKQNFHLECSIISCSPGKEQDFS